MVKSRGKRVAVVTAVVAGVVLALVAFAFRHRIREHWEIRRLYSEDVEVRDQALEWLVERESLLAIPALLEMLAAPDSRPPIISRLRDNGSLSQVKVLVVAEDPSAHLRAGELFPEYGAYRLDLRPGSHVGVWDTGDGAPQDWVPITDGLLPIAEGLWRIVQGQGRASVYPVLRGFDENEWRARSFCAAMLGRLGPDASPVIEHILRDFGRVTPHERCVYLDAMVSVAPGDPRVAAIVNEALSDNSRFVQIVAEEALKKIQPPAPGPEDGGE